jgi:glycogen(starch) synthase
LQNQLSTRLVWPQFRVRRPLFISHHIFPSQDPSPIRRYLKLRLSRVGTNLAISDALLRSLPQKCIRVHNPFRYDLFRSVTRCGSQQDFIFIGRLLPQKKVDDFLCALTRSRARGVERSATIVGEGEERRRLEQLGRGLPIRFVGTQTGRELAELLSAHRWLVLPSTRNETFGIVALEAIAAGCRVIGSDHGGIPEAIGSCGAIFPAGDVEALAELLMCHLAPFRPENVAQEYLALFEKALHSGRAVH